MPRFEVRTGVAAPPRQVFDLSLDIQVHTESMAGSAEKAIGGVTEGRLKLGESVTWQARHFGIPWRMTSVISAYERPGYFVDTQTSGPFKRWQHAHHFESDGSGGTIMRDVIDFAAPLGILGTIAERVALNRYLPRLIQLRNEHVKAVAEAGRPDPESVD